jgi:pyruvate dehydrogenase E1 component alpha subunit
LFYEVTNMASLWQLPVVYVMENNQYGEYTSTVRSTAGSGPARAEAMHIPAVTVDGNDVFAVYGAAQWAVGRARAGEGPSLIECQTYRWRGHHMGDQGDTYGYRNQQEIEGWMERCPIRRYQKELIDAAQADAATLKAIDEEVQQFIDEAVAYAKEAPYPDPSEVYQHVYA